VEQSKGKKQAVHLTVHSDSAIASKLEGKITTVFMGLVLSNECI